MARRSSTTNSDQAQDTQSYWDKIGTEVESNQSKLSMILGALIVLVVGILVFNYFSKNQPDLGPAQQTQQEGDVSRDQLPGKYTAKEGDTLFLIAEKYYQDGSKYQELATANNLINADAIEAGQILEIPKLEEIQTPTPVTVTDTTEETTLGTGGADTTIWGPKIEGDTYTVLEGDWLSTIAARAYGDIMAYPKIAQANNIQNPDLIYPGQVLTLPR